MIWIIDYRNNPFEVYDKTIIYLVVQNRKVITIMYDFYLISNASILQVWT